MSVEIEELSKTRGARTVLEGVDLNVPPEANLGLLGPEGAGKTTLTRIVAGLEPATAGSVRVGEREVLGAPAARPRVGYVPCRPGLDEDRTPRELLRFGGRLHGIPTSELERRLEQRLIDTRLEHLGSHAIEHLSAGARRRLSLAYASIHDPLVLLVDEPTLGLGPEATERMHRALQAVTDERALLLASRQAADVERHCEHVVGLEDGRIVLDAPLEELLAEEGQAVEVQLAGGLPQQALDVIREHAAVAALRRDPEDVEADLELWITDPDQASQVLEAMVEAGAPVAAFTPRGPRLAEVVAEYMEAPL